MLRRRSSQQPGDGRFLRRRRASPERRSSKPGRPGSQIRRENLREQLGIRIVCRAARARSRPSSHARAAASRSATSASRRIVASSASGSARCSPSRPLGALARGCGFEHVAQIPAARPPSRALTLFAIVSRMSGSRDQADRFRPSCAPPASCPRGVAKSGRAAAARSGNRRNPARSAIRSSNASAPRPRIMRIRIFARRHLRHAHDEILREQRSRANAPPPSRPPRPRRNKARLPRRTASECAPASR